jgi:mannose-6-phosphate isomerase-like protein (cupin superfamily)/deoxycytidylate deaminase
VDQGFDTMQLPDAPDAVAPDGSDVRVLLRLGRGSMAHFELGAGRVSRAVAHRAVDEIWYIVAGQGQMWRRQADRQETVPLRPGTCVSIPAGTHFQFRSVGDGPLAAVGVTMPPWPGDDEAYDVPGAWAPRPDAGLPGENSLRCEEEVGMQPGQEPLWRPLKRHDSHVAEQMVARAAELARDSHAQTRYAAVLVKDGSLLAWGTNGVPFPGEDHCYCKFGESGHHDRCRTHAEQRAITLAREGDGWRMLQGSKLIYVRLEADDSVRLDEPHFCARCSRLALSLGVAEWIFALSEGLVGYASADYDQIAQLRW